MLLWDLFDQVSVNVFTIQSDSLEILRSPCQQEFEGCFFDLTTLLGELNCD